MDNDSHAHTHESAPESQPNSPDPWLDDEEVDIESDPLGREVESRLEGRTAHNPSNRSPVRLRSRGAAALKAVSSAILSASRMLLPRVDHGGVHRPCLAALTSRSSTDPPNRKAAMREDKVGWGEAEESEYHNHLSNESFEYIDRSQLPTGRKLVKFTWAYKRKRSGKQKARLCVQGCTQVPGIDYDQTHCATMRSTSLRALSAISAKHGMCMRRWDFVAAYLQGSLLDGEVVYCPPPPGHEHKAGIGSDGLPRICRVRKPIYGMAQAGRRWQRSLFPWLEHPDQGFTRCHHDQCVFHQSREMVTPDGPRTETLIIGVYVDDLFVISSHNDEHSLYHSFTTNLQQKWQVEDEGEIHDLLNVEITRDGDDVILKQSQYIEKMVDTFCPDGVPTSFQASSPPCDDKLPLMVCDALVNGDPVDPKLLREYQAIVGSLLYCATQTRPDVAFAVGYLGRAMGKPTPQLLQAARRVLYYLHRHKEVGLRYSSSPKRMEGMSDSDWATKHSTSGMVFMFQTAAISWGSKKQATIALSSTEAEIVAASEAAKEAISLHGLLSELGQDDDRPTRMFVDNQSAIAVAYNPEHHSRMKHVERRHFFVRECVEDFKLEVPFVRTHENLADFFTKPLAGKDASRFFTLRNVIMNHS